MQAGTPPRRSRRRHQSTSETPGGSRWSLAALPAAMTRNDEVAANLAVTSPHPGDRSRAPCSRAGRAGNPVLPPLRIPAFIPSDGWSHTRCTSPLPGKRLHEGFSSRRRRPQFVPEPTTKCAAPLCNMGRSIRGSSDGSENAPRHCKRAAALTKSTARREPRPRSFGSTRTAGIPRELLAMRPGSTYVLSNQLSSLSLW